MIEIAPAFLRQRPLPVPVEGDKKSRGNVLIIAGATELPGAAMLAGIAALRGAPAGCESQHVSGTPPLSRWPFPRRG